MGIVSKSTVSLDAGAVKVMPQFDNIPDQRALVSGHERREYSVRADETDQLGTGQREHHNLFGGIPTKTSDSAVRWVRERRGRSEKYPKSQPFSRAEAREAALQVKGTTRCNVGNGIPKISKFRGQSGPPPAAPRAPKPSIEAFYQVFKYSHRASNPRTVKLPFSIEEQ